MSDFTGNKSAKISEVFTDLNRKFEEQQAQRTAKVHNLPYFDLTGFPIDEVALAEMSVDEAVAAQVIPFYKEGPLLRIAIVDPKNKNLLAVLETLKKKSEVEPYLVSKSGLEAAMGQYKKIIAPVQAGSRHEVTVATGADVLEKLKHLPLSDTATGGLTISEILEMIIGAAVNTRSSDIHLEPEKKFMKVRFRIDGVLQDIATLPTPIVRNLLSRIKLLSGLKLNITSVPQDGRFSIKSDDRNLDLRVSVLPTNYGESVVIRILGIQDVGLDINDLGLRGMAFKVVQEELEKPNGMILTTGPTGSGKTTTLYAFLNYLNRSGVKIITLEDPVEYQLEGINQTPIDRSGGMDFAKGLRSILRQDPDIVMVGEIRDFETGETAAQAALTGHMVLSTLHTNDAAGAIPRLLDLGVKPVTLAPALNALLAQRLLRRICPDCKEVYRPAPKEMERVKSILSQIPSKSVVDVPKRYTFYHGKGCAKCHDLGYRGRVGIFEVFAVDDKIQQAIFDQVSTNQIKKLAVDAGMVTMQQDGLLKALEGLTDLAEVWRVTEE
ncbi:MAG: GspE/PulE family protein [Candidatus Doudnabacteria bacterium]|nr:GspE/PulE family protein [bacterium]MDZ4243946.1 GspE/PulE family protein [Candidatus Doudnabacteria bacterium]